jgi:hypothetical protein
MSHQKLTAKFPTENPKRKPSRKQRGRYRRTRNGRWTFEKRPGAAR